MSALCPGSIAGSARVWGLVQVGGAVGGGVSLSAAAALADPGFDVAGCSED